MRSPLLASALLWIGLAPAAVRAADPAAAVYSRDGSRLFWLVQISDSHIGSEWYAEDGRLRWALGEALGVIQPELVINTGDLCDGSLHGVPATGQSEGEWSLYRQIVDEAGLPPEYYLDLPGNHDGYGDAGLSFYLDWSLHGSTYQTTTGGVELSFPFGDYFVYGCATPDESGAVLVEHPEFSLAELDELEAELSAHEADELLLVFGHHPLDQPDRSDVARWILHHYRALYFHGHSHAYETYLLDDLVCHQVNSLGKARSDNLAVIAVDNNWLTYTATSSDDPWPFVVVTAPADARLTSGDAHPYAYPVCNSAADNPVRALVFDLAEVDQVTFRAGDGTAQPMVRDEAQPALWHGAWDTRGLAEGELDLTVTATGSQTRSRTIFVRLADVDCPPPLDEADGGPADGSDLDGGQGDGGELDGSEIDGDRPDGGEPDEDAVDGGPADGGTDGTDEPADGGGDGPAADAEPRPDDEPDAGGEADDQPAPGCGCGPAGGGPPAIWLLGLLLLGSLRRTRHTPS